MAKKKLGKKLSNKLGKKIKKFGSKIGKSSLLKNSATLYFVLLISIGLVLMYLSKKDYNSLIVLIATGLLTNYFTKNMTITLGVAIIVSLIVRMKISKKEGFKEGNTDTAEEKDSVEIVKKLAEEATSKKTCFKWNEDKGENGEWESQDGVSEDDCKQVDDGPEMCFSADSGDCNKKDGFSKRLIPSSEPAKVGNDEDEVDTDRIDYASTLEQAYDNLQGMLGKEGIKGLTSETSKLVQQQAGLMESLKGMGPMLKEAKSMMSGMKDMGSMETMKDMKSILNSVGGKKL
jgi:hypothetical protein